MAPSIHVAPINPNDWLVRDDTGRELGHYPTQESAETVGRALARKRKAELVVRDLAGRAHRERFAKSWFIRLLGG
jgi:hypothetical protein